MWILPCGYLQASGLVRVQVLAKLFQPIEQFGFGDEDDFQGRAQEVQSSNVCTQQHHCILEFHSGIKEAMDVRHLGSFCRHLRDGRGDDWRGGFVRWRDGEVVLGGFTKWFDTDTPKLM